METIRAVDAIPEMSHFIGGEFRKADGVDSIAVWNPATAEQIFTIPEGTKAVVEDAFRAAEAAQRVWWAMAPRDRERKLRRVALLMESNLEHLADVEVANTGKPVALARAEAQVAVEAFYFAAGFPSKQAGKSIPVADSYQLCYTIVEPVGVAAAVTPWNYPLVIASIKVASALAAGCAVILKPSPETPLTALELARLVEEAGLPSGVLNVVTGGREAGASVVEHPGIAKVSFTGSTATGESILHALADNLRPSVLELGGKSPSIVFPDIDLEAAIESILMGALANTGQECCAGARILVHEDVYDEFLDVARDRLLEFSVGGPESEANLGPLISRRQQEKVGGFVERALSSGATVHAAGKVPNTGFFYPPTLLTNVEDSMEIWREEVFGPVLAIDSFASDSEALEKANDSRYGLAAGIWTGDVGRAVRFARDLQAGKVWINSYLSGSSSAPFGGVKDSGFGRESGVEGILEYTQVKTVHVQGAPKPSGTEN